MSNNNKFTFNLDFNSPNEVVLEIYDIIGETSFGNGITANYVLSLLKGAENRPLNVKINSAGGDVQDGIAIYNLLLNHQGEVTVNIDSVAASMASVIAMAGDVIRIASNARMMIHDAWGLSVGGSDQLRKDADQLDSITETIAETYAARTKISKKKIRQMMSEETWFTAKEAIKKGFADEIVPANSKLKAAALDLSAFKNTPADLFMPAEKITERSLSAPFSDAALKEQDLKQKGTKMNEIFALLGVADEEKAAHKVKGLVNAKNLFAQVEEITGYEGSEAIGTVRALKEKAESADKLIKDHTKKEFDGLIAQGKEEQKLTPAMAKFYSEKFEKAEGKKDSEVVEDLRGFLAVASKVIPGGDVKEPKGDNQNASALSYNGKSFGELKPMDRVQLKDENPELYEEMRKDALAQGVI